MKRRELSTLIIISAVLWAAALITLGVFLLSGQELPFTLKNHTDSSEHPIDFTPEARIDVIDVGQGSALLVKINGDYTKGILIDAGETDYSDEVCRAINDVGLSSLDLVVITHPHSDHFGGAAEVLQRYQVSELWMPDVPLELTPTGSTYQKFLEVLEKSSCRVKLKSKPETLKLSEDAYISILNGFVYQPSNLNDLSLCLRVDIGDVSFLVTGDGESALENTLLQNDANVDTDILIVGHHGSNTSSSHIFLNAASPIASVISVGKDNDYGHPDSEVYARLAKFGNVYRTDINGTVTFFTDGRRIAVSAKNISDNLNARR